MANTEKNIFNAVAAILLADATVSGYNKQVYKSPRENIPKQAFPCIHLGPARTLEHSATSPRRHMMIHTVRIAACVRNEKWDDVVVGDSTMKGIYDFVDDIKNALDVYPDLNYDSTSKRCDWFLFDQTDYHISGNVKDFPFWIAEILMSCHVMTAGATR